MPSSLSNHLPSGSKSRCVCARLLRLLAREALGLSSARRRPVGGGVFRRSTPALLVLGMGPWVRRPRPTLSLRVAHTLYIITSYAARYIYVHIYRLFERIKGELLCNSLGTARYGMVPVKSGGVKPGLGVGELEVRYAG